MSVIEIDDLTRDYGEGRGIFNVSFSVEQGEVFGFLGPNGAGKTTTIRHLMGFIKNKSGKCTIDGLDCWKDSQKIQERLGYIPGEINYFDDMTGKEFLDFVSKYRGLSDRSRREELIDMFELNANGKIKKMSKGMKQKIGIISAFMHNPDIIILDEPTSGLDPLMQNRFIELIESEKQKGRTILLSSHIFEEVERTCDRIGIIRAGKIVTVDSTQNLRKKHMHTYNVRLEAKEDAIAFAKDFDGVFQEGSDATQGDNTGYIVTVSAKQSLETIFMNYYGGGKDD